VSEPTKTAHLSSSEENMLPSIPSTNLHSQNIRELTAKLFHFTYHEILPGDAQYLYRVSTAALEEHLTFLSSLDSPPRISFDDGHRSNYEHAFPILERFGIKATFFLLAGHAGNNKDYLTWEQAREMSQAGHVVASHGWSHRMLTLCNSLELDQELADSKREIENRLGIAVDAISAPGGRWNKQVTDACVRAGYRHFFHSNPWEPSVEGANLSVQGRLMMTRGMGAPELRKQMDLSELQRSVLRAKYAGKERVRRLMGERLYHRIWTLLAKWNPEDGMEVLISEPIDKKKGLERS